MGMQVSYVRNLQHTGPLQKNHIKLSHLKKKNDNAGVPPWVLNFVYLLLLDRQQCSLQTFLEWEQKEKQK